MSKHLLELVKNLPKSPGVYQYLDITNNIIYVGKAKNLKNRVSSYFNKDKHISGKTKLLVKRIADIKFIVVNTEFDALLLENSLIKKHQPKYNIQLRDDKTYPWICIKKERFPRIFSTRNRIKDGSEYIGPYASVKVMNAALSLVNQLYPLRNCNFNLSQENIDKGKFKECLEFHIGNCLAPCVGKQTEENYLINVQNIRRILKGDIKQVINHQFDLMKQYADELKFELAENTRQKIDLLERYQSRSTVVNPTINDVDVFSIIDKDDFSYVNFMKIMNGSVIQSHSIELKKQLDENSDDLLKLAITELRIRFNSISKNIYTSISTDMEIPDVTFFTPQKGEKKRLVQLSERNAKAYALDAIKARDKVDPDRHAKRILSTLQTDLGMKKMPTHIECFDNSNFQGSNPVAACVVFKMAKPSKKDYRHFNIKTVEGPDDFASMEEVVYRRYRRLLNEEKPIPQLIVIDGGKGQLSSSLKSIYKLGLEDKVTMVGIAKKLEEIYFPGDSIPLYIDKKSESLKLIQNLRNEAHRFGITFHRNKRSKRSIHSVLDEISGVGNSTKDMLLKKFKSVKRIKEASLTELQETIPLSRAKKVFAFFNQKEN